MGFSHFVFDLDGTLIDTEQAVLKTWQATLREYGYDFSLDEVRVVLGVTTEAGLAHLGAAVDESYAARWQKNYAAFAPQCRYFAGTKEMLCALRQKGCRLGAVTSRCRAEYEQYFGGFDLQELMDFVVLAEDTQKHKPDAEPLQKYLELAGAAPQECIYIGDMPTDALCAGSAGVTSALVRWNGSSVDTSAADLVLYSTDEVLALAL